MVIDLEGISSRVLPFPVAEGRYHKVQGIKGKALFLSQPIEGTLELPLDDPDIKGRIDSYDFEALKSESIIDGVNDFTVSRNSKTLMYRNGHRLRVVKAGEKPPKSENNDRPGRESGWLDLHRIKVSVQPAAEWKQMFHEAWRLQREHFWTEDMSGIDWDAIYAQYAPLVERVSSRSELSDLFWELQGELNTSHAYEQGGEYRHGPHYRQGFLGVDWKYDSETDRYREAALTALETLCTDRFLARSVPDWEGILLHGVYHFHKGLGVDESVAWGDHFFVEALVKAIHGRSAVGWCLA